MLDILLFREERGNDPERIRESQRRRFASVELVDEVIKLDKEWRQRQFEVENMRKEVNKVQDGIKKKKIAKEDPADLLAEKTRLEEAKVAKEKEAVECKAAMEAKLRLVGNLVHDSVPVDNNEVGVVEFLGRFWFLWTEFLVDFWESRSLYLLGWILAFNSVSLLKQWLFTISSVGFVEQDNNQVVRKWGTLREEAGLFNHVDLVNKLGIVELEAGIKNLPNFVGDRGIYIAFRINSSNSLIENAAILGVCCEFFLSHEDKILGI